MTIYVGKVAVVLGLSLLPARTAAAQDGLGSVYDEAVKRARYIDLTHEITPGIPVWGGVVPVADIVAFEARHGRIPEGVVLLVRSDWSKDRPEPEVTIGAEDAPLPKSGRPLHCDAPAGRRVR